MAIRRALHFEHIWMHMPTVTAIVSRSTNRVSLVQGKDYEVIGIDDSCFRIVDESGEPALHPKNYFLDVAFAIPAGWVIRKYDDSEYTSSPPELSPVGFYEDYADGRSDAIRAYREYCQSRKLVRPNFS